MAKIRNRSTNQVKAQCNCETVKYHRTIGSGNNSMKKCMKCGAEGRVVIIEGKYEVFGELYR